MIIKCKNCHHCDFNVCTLNDKNINAEEERECDDCIISNPNARWEKGLPHHPKAKDLAREIAKIDFDNGDYFCFKFGGDGDNGEHLTYLLDCYFECKEKGF
jgi:hypothetical protein